MWQNEPYDEELPFDEAIDAFGEEYIPTKEQFQELFDNCTLKQERNELTLVSKINGKKIIVPAKHSFQYKVYWSKTESKMGFAEAAWIDVTERIFIPTYKNMHQGYILVLKK